MKHSKCGHSSIPKDITFPEILTINFEIWEQAYVHTLESKSNQLYPNGTSITVIYTAIYYYLATKKCHSWKHCWNNKRLD